MIRIQFLKFRLPAHIWGINSALNIIYPRILEETSVEEPYVSIIIPKRGLRDNLLLIKASTDREGMIESIKRI